MSYNQICIDTKVLDKFISKNIFILNKLKYKILYNDKLSDFAVFTLIRANPNDDDFLNKLLHHNNLPSKFLDYVYSHFDYNYIKILLEMKKFPSVSSLISVNKRVPTELKVDYYNKVKHKLKEDDIVPFLNTFITSYWWDFVNSSTSDISGEEFIDALVLNYPRKMREFIIYQAGRPSWAANSFDSFCKTYVKKQGWVEEIEV